LQIEVESLFYGLRNRLGQAIKIADFAKSVYRVFKMICVIRRIQSNKVALRNG
jgi:hypothetical protein